MPFGLLADEGASDELGAPGLAMDSGPETRAMSSLFEAAMVDDVWVGRLLQCGPHVKWKMGGTVESSGCKMVLGRQKKSWARKLVKEWKAAASFRQPLRLHNCRKA